jgi:hypothetical protein
VTRARTGYWLVDSSTQVGQRWRRLVGTGSLVTAHTAAGRIGRLVSCVVERSSCRSIMPRQEEFAFLKAISTLQLSPVILRELKLAYVTTEEDASGARREPRHHIWWGQRPQRSSGQIAGKRKANELASSGDSSEPANRRPAPGAGSAHLPANTTVTGEKAAVGSRQLM